MNTQNLIYRTCVLWIAIALPLTVYGENGRVPSLLSETATAKLVLTRSSILPGRINRNRRTTSAGCSAYIPADATISDSLELCRFSRSGKNEIYACQTFAAVDGRYRVFFKGGRHPKAIARVTESGEVTDILWSENKQASRPVCDFPPPIEIPAETKFMGAGVCIDEADQSVPCTVFRHEAARIKSVYDYMIFYKPDGSGPNHTTLVYIGENKNAMAAELSYQIGLGLLKTNCCQQSGLGYVEHALQLFPNSVLYRTAYHYYKQQASMEVHQDNLYADRGGLK